MPSKVPDYKVCLINPPVLAVLEPWYDTPSFGRTSLAYLAGYLRQYEGYEIHIIDAKFERLSFEAVRQRVNKIKPDLVGFTAFTNEIKPAAYQAALLKKDFPSLLTVVGGPHITALPKETLGEFASFDIGVVGEGEITLHELCDALKNDKQLREIPGIVYREQQTILQTPPRERILDQDSIPFPAWDMLPPAETYFVQSIRGCPYNCLFCMNPGGRVARKRSVENVMEELWYIIDQFKPKRISFGDELFSVDMERTRKLLDAMAENKIGESVSWDVQTHVNYVDEDLFIRFKKANVSRVEVGIETGDEAVLKKMGKGTSMESIIEACDTARKVGVKIGTFFLLGQPNENAESLKKTLELAVKVNPDLPMFGLMTPYPGTEVAKMAAKGVGGYKLLSTDWDEYNKQIGGAMEFAGMTRQQIEWFQVKAYLKVYLYNRRYYDLIQFLFEYRKAAWEVLKKIVTRRKALSHSITKPTDYDELVYPKNPINFEAFISSRDDWKEIQKNEMKRSRQSEIS